MLQNIVNDETDAKHVERVYCGHIYHNDCLIKYMKTPPFQGTLVHGSPVGNRDPFINTTNLY